MKIIFCHVNPIIFGPKGIFVQQNLHKFLHDVSQVVNRVIVWSFMMKSTMEMVTDFLFTENKAPFDVLGQD